MYGKLDMMGFRISLWVSRERTSLHIIRKPSMKTQGMTSRCYDKKHHVLFLDYDNIERHIVWDDILDLQKRFNIGPMVILTTHEYISNISNEATGNYHVICPEKFLFQEIPEMQMDCHIDPKYKKMWRRSRLKSWVLRIIEKGDRPKPKFVEWVGFNVENKREASEAHIRLMNAKLGVPIPKYYIDKFDGETKTFITSYATNAGKTEEIMELMEMGGVKWSMD